MLKKRTKTQVRKTEADVFNIPISHNCPDKVLDMLVQELLKNWGLTPGHKIQVVLNELLPKNQGFIYDRKKLIQFKFQGGKFEYNEVDQDSIKMAMVKNSIKA
jgi:hypothetical protein